MVRLSAVSPPSFHTHRLLQICNIVFDHRHLLAPLEVLMLGLDDPRTDKPYQKAWDARNSSSRKENPISRLHTRIPYGPDLEALVATLNAERMLNTPQPPIPSSTWDKNAVVLGTPHYLIMRSSSYRFRDIKDWRRDAPALCAAFLFEHYCIQEYRPTLLKKEAGLIRHKLLEILRPELSRDMIVSVDGLDYLRFSDGLYFPPFADDGPVVDPERRLLGAQAHKELFTELHQFYKRFRNLKSIRLLTSRYLADEGPHIEAQIAESWNAFATVRVPFFLIPAYAYRPSHSGLLSKHPLYRPSHCPRRT